MKNSINDENASSPKTSSVADRLASLDALRGFDMFWIIGAEPLFRALTQITNASWAGAISEQLTHRDWEGFTFYDLIFPLFIFIVGISIVFSIDKSLEAKGKVRTLQRVFLRAGILYLLGVFYYGGISNGLDQVRLMGVLQRIALCYLFASLAYFFLDTKGRVLLTIFLLGGYWAMMKFIPIPEFGAGNFEEGKNLANYIDKVALPFHKHDGDHDPEGLLSTIPAIATCLLGIFVGSLLRNEEVKDSLKVLYLIVAGVALVALGFLWGLEFPVIKKIWTSSYVLVSAGYSCFLMASFYFVIEMMGLKIWAMPFVWIGMNPITIYLAHEIIDFENLAHRLAGGELKTAFGDFGELLIFALVLFFSLCFVKYLYRKQLFLKV